MSALIEQVLSSVKRRYRMPAIPTPSGPWAEHPTTQLAVVIEHVRRSIQSHDRPDDGQKRAFIVALGRLIQEAISPGGGDAAFQALVLRHQSSLVSEYESLFTHIDKDRRTVHALVNRLAHPAKLQNMRAGELREGLAQLRNSADRAAWAELANTASVMVSRPEVLSDSSLTTTLQQLRDGLAVARLQRLDILTASDVVQRYQSLKNHQGPFAGNAAALAQGAASRRRGAAVEKRAAQALETLVLRLQTQLPSACSYRVVTSVHASPALPADAQYAKGEWDVMLLKQAPSTNNTASWDICLLVEAKASVEAATTDLPRLVRGLQLLSSAHPEMNYAFGTAQGTVTIRGASLRALHADQHNLANRVIYCCDVPADEHPRLLSHASRMQLLSDEASLAFASQLSLGEAPDTACLSIVWDHLLSAVGWHALRHQYHSMYQARELMVHVDDLATACAQLAVDVSLH